ncbi:MAG: glycosyltransferase family 39 protein [Elusimicrobia bacterium]|nr:glycosyltransferase family 39 protein [Elusimicrobiota bacterium]
MKIIESAGSDERRVAAGLLLFGAAWLALRLLLIRDRVFDMDELEHLHGAWLVARGQVPFRDFFEHHGPLFPFLLAPLTALIHDPIRAVWAARLFMLALTAATMKVLWNMTAPGRGLLARALPVLLLCSFTTFADKSLEVRPDVPAMALLSLALLCASGGASSLKMRLAAGFLLGLAFFFTPKIAYPAAGLVIGWLISDVAGQGAVPGSAWKDLLRRWACFFLGAAVPFAGLALYFLATDGGRAFYECFYAFNRRFRAGFPFTVFWLPSFRENAAVWSLGLFGAFICRKETVKVCALGAAAAGAVLLPVVYAQYYLLTAPLLCFFAAGALGRLSGGIRGRAARAALALGLCISLVPSFRNQLGSLRDTNATQIEGIACVMSRTAPQDRVFDVWTGESFYRPHAYYFWFLHDEVRAMLDPGRLEKEIGLALADPRCKGLVWGAYFNTLPAGVLDRARRNYSYAGCGRLFLKNPPPAKP